MKERIITKIKIDKLFIVSPYISDFELMGRGAISFFIKKLANRAEISIITSTPRNRKQTDFIMKLLNHGIQIYINSRLHAKVILCLTQKEQGITIMGSANLTFVHL